METMTELALRSDPDAPSHARRLTTSSLADEPPATVESAQTVVTELVTNAVLHGEPPVTLRLARGDDVVRIEVEDAGRELPVQARHDVEAMTGRGLELVAALASSWGVEPGSSGGKVVWAELPDDGRRTGGAELPDVDVDALLASWPEDDLDTELHTVRLPPVPTDLLLDVKSHIDDVVREFTLASTEDELGGALPGRVARLVATVTKDFGAARAEIKRQALAAAERGDPETELVLRLPAAAADAGERYLAALDDVDRFAHAARVLTLETPAVHRVFRRWYVHTLIDQLRAAARGRPAPAPRTFLQALASEVTELATLRDAWDKLQLLQKVTGELTGAHSVEDIAATIVENVSVHLGALAARVYLLGADDVLRSVAASGAAWPVSVMYHEVPLDADLPGPVALRTGQPLLMRNRAELAQRFPVLAGIYPTERSLHVAPLLVGTRRVGILSLTFPPGGELDEPTQVAFVGALADALAQALERALAMQRAAEAGERLAFLADASVALSASLDHHETVEALTHLLVPRLADWCIVHELADGELERVGLYHADPDRRAWAERTAARFPTRMDAPSGAANVVRTGRSELHPDISDELLRLSAVDDEHLAAIRQLGMSSGLVVPLIGRSGAFGALTLIYAESNRRYTEADIPFVEDVARRAALALENARAFHQQSGRLADVTRVAEAAQHAILATPPPRLGPVALAARYVSAAAEALVGGDLYEVVRRRGAVRLLIGDVRGKGLAAVRTATIVLGEFRAAAGDADDLVAVAAQIDRRLRPYLADEDFVTGLLAEVRDDGTYLIAACGHPPALLAAHGRISELPAPPTLPFGLGAAPTLVTGRLEVGDRLLLYTDGVLEARDPQRRLVELLTLVQPLAHGDLDVGLEQVLAGLRRVVGGELGDDVALLVAEYRGC